MTEEPRSTPVRGLPPAGRRRIEALRSGAPWSSQQTVGAEAALRTLGFEPAGVVLASVYSYGILPQAPPGYRQRTRPIGGTVGYTPLDDPMSAKRSGGYVHDWSVDSQGQPRMDLGWTWERMVRQHSERRIANETIAKLILEARSIGAHGILDINFLKRDLGTDPQRRMPVYELSMSGTALRVPGLAPIATPFTTGLNATEVAKVLSEGYAPVNYLMGIGVVSGQLGAHSRRTLRSKNNGEIEQYSEVTEQSLRIARVDLEHRAAAFGAVVLGENPQLEVHHSAGETYDATTRIAGSTLRRFRHGVAANGLSFLPVVPLNLRPQTDHSLSDTDGS
jgi:uncharacterized protein YbjQ (UPF0145 family)